MSSTNSIVLNSGSPPLPPLGARLRHYHVRMNPYSHRVQLVLAAKGVKVDTVELHPLRLPAWFREKNPRVKIPVLEVPSERGDRLIFESIVICDYLDEQYPRPQLHSRDPCRKAEDRLIIERFNELIKGILDCFDTNFSFGAQQILSTLTTLNKELETRGTEYFAGSRPGMLDYMVWPWLERLYLLRCVNEEVFNKKLALYPSLADWGEMMQTDSAVKKFAHTPQEYYNHYRNTTSLEMDY